MSAILRGLAVAALILVVGLVGLWAVFTDLRPGASLVPRILIVALLYVGTGALVGRLLPRFWYLAVLLAWGPALWGLVGLVARSLPDHPEMPYSPGLGFFLVMFLVVPGVALASGRLGKTWALRTAF